MQVKQSEWHEQWAMLKDDERFLFDEWIHPRILKDFAGKDVLEGGCGGGQHTGFVAKHARSVTAVDLNTIDLAKERNVGFQNINFVEADLSKMNLGRQFDVVFSIGVIHHTDAPDLCIDNLVRHVKPGGLFIVWVYSHEGNTPVRWLVEPFRKVVLRHLRRRTVLALSKLTTFFLYFPVYTIYLLPLRGLPFYAYFGNFRRLSFYRNTLNVFDKLNAPQVQFIDRNRLENWFRGVFTDVHISQYKGVSWRASGKKL